MSFDSRDKSGFLFCVGKRKCTTPLLISSPLGTVLPFVLEKRCQDTPRYLRSRRENSPRRPNLAGETQPVLAAVSAPVAGETLSENPRYRYGNYHLPTSARTPAVSRVQRKSRPRDVPHVRRTLDGVKSGENDEYR